MAMLVVGQPPLLEASPIESTMNSEISKLNYENVIKPQKSQYKPLLLKEIAGMHGEPRIVWEEEEVN